MTLRDRLAHLRTAPDDADLAELLGLTDAGGIRIGGDGITVDGETVSRAEVLALLRGESAAEAAPAADRPTAARRRVQIEDL